MSIRLRLTLLYSTILALTLIAFSVVLYVTVSRVTYTVLLDTLIDEAKRISTSERFQFDNIDYPAKRFAAPETYIQTRYITGQILDRTENLGDVALPLPEDGLKACQLGQPWTDIMTTEDGQLMVYSQPVVKHGEIVGIIQVARSMNEHEQTLSTLRSILTLGSSISTVVAFGIGWLISGASLRPISRFTATVQSIGAERDFGRRVEYTGPNDEIGQLTSTFNVMLSELQSAYRQAEQSLQAQRRLVADASHELRTPLTTLRGNLGLLQRTPPISQQDRDDVLKDMVEECERLMRLVNDLLVLARADTGRPLRIEEVELRPLIEEVYRQVQRLDTGRPIEIDSALEQLSVAGNRDALKQVLLILVDNALKYTPPNGTVSIFTSSNDGKVTIAVKDTGTGIAPHVLPHIFERFYRGDSSRTGEGAGLGLSIAKTLMEVQGGTITVESTLGKGTTVLLSLPQFTTTAVEQARSIGQ
jgi:two-component system OmpR family sensor kinase